MRDLIKNIRNVLKAYAFEEHTVVKVPLILMYLGSCLVWLIEAAGAIVITLIIVPLSIIELCIWSYDFIKTKMYTKRKLVKIITDHHNAEYGANKSYYLQNEVISSRIQTFVNPYIDIERFINWFIYFGRVDYYTYSKITNTPVCDKDRRRSAGDIYLICKHYYPDCTFEQVMKILLDLVDNDDNSITCGYCSIIHKLVFFTCRGRDASVGTRTEYKNNITLGDLIKIYK